MGHHHDKKNVKMRFFLDRAKSGPKPGPNLPLIIFFGCFLRFFPSDGDPYGIRTRVTRMKIWRPRPG
jgi:hypothetical protein